MVVRDDHGVDCDLLAVTEARLNAASTSRSPGSNCGLFTCRRKTSNSWRSTRISSSFERSPRPSSTTSANNRQTTTYTSDTSKDNLHQTGHAEANAQSAVHAPPPPVRPSFCTPRHRPHRSLNLAPPEPSEPRVHAVRAHDPSAIQRRDRLGGPIHEYNLAA